MKSRQKSNVQTKSKFRSPESPEEWQNAVNIAEALIGVELGRQYGVFSGGPRVDVVRCLDFVGTAVRMGIVPQEEEVQALMDSIARPALRKVGGRLPS